MRIFPIQGRNEPRTIDEIVSSLEDANISVYAPESFDVKYHCNDTIRDVHGIIRPVTNNFDKNYAILSNGRYPSKYGYLNDKWYRESDGEWFEHSEYI